MNRPTAPTGPRDRFDVYRFFNGISAEVQEGLAHGRTRVPLVKTFLLEHVSSRGGRIPSPPAEILKRVGVEARHLDETFMELRVWEQGEDDTSPKPKTAGYLEQYDERFFAYYTADRADTARKRVNRWVNSSPDLDSTWFSGQLLQSLWDRDVSKRGDNRFSKLVFRHESIFDMPEDVTQAPEEEEGEAADEIPDEDRPERDRRRVRSEIRDRIGPIRAALTNLQGTYPPLNALYSLRLPSVALRGSHDLYQMGQVTNRAESFEDHRNTVRYLYRTYKSVLERTERSAWEGPEEALPLSTARARFKGVPLIINFTEQLSEATFNRWANLAFQKRNQFRLWGDPIRLGPTKIHVYGADRHLWQPINLEMSASRVVAILPKGTCGNTFHRLVTNVQRYVCPKIEVWLGATPFQQLMSEVQASLEEGDGMRSDQLIRDPIFQLNLLLWMTKEQPPDGYVVKPLFFENGFRVVYIEQPFAFPQETVLAIQKSQGDISTAPEPELLLGRMADKVALYFEAKADSFSVSSTNCKQARAHLLATGKAFGEVMAPYQSCLLCYVVPDEKRSLMDMCLDGLVTELGSCGLHPGKHSCHGLSVAGQDLHYSWDTNFKTYTGISGTSAIVLSPVTDDTDPSPLFLIYTDEDYPDPENHNLLRRCVVNQVHAYLVCDLHRQRFDDTYERSAESLLAEMSEGLYEYLGRKRQKAMRRLVTDNVFRRIVEYSKERFPGVKLLGDVLKVTFADEQGKVGFLEWLEDFKRTAFQAEKPPDEPPSLFDGLDETAGGGEE